jgi:uncharacterized protein
MFFKKQSSDILGSLVNITENMIEASTSFCDGIRDYKDAEQLVKQIKRYELIGDQLTQSVIRELNNLFLPPFDSVDILLLTTKLDDILDGIHETALRFDMYGIKLIDPFMLEFATNVEESVNQVGLAIKTLQQKKLNHIHAYIVKINDLEKVADKLLRDSIKSIFKRTNDSIEVLKLRDIYLFLEGISDSCEDVSNALETIVMKNQ